MPHRTGHTAQQSESEVDASNAGVDQVIVDLEHGLVRDDPEFVRRLNKLAGAEVANAVHVVVLLVVSALLLAVGLASRSGFAWVAGAAAFVMSFGVDERYKRRFGVRRPEGSLHGPPARLRQGGEFVGAAVGSESVVQVDQR
jgi:hypothetical protein